MLAGICGNTTQSFTHRIYNCYNGGSIYSDCGNVGTIAGSVYNDSAVTNVYFIKTNEINNSLNTIGNWKKGTKSKYSMFAYFDFPNATTFTYVDDTTEVEGYEGNLLTKLNKWIENQNSTRYLTWKLDEITGYPIV